jgi:endonuclease III
MAAPSPQQLAGAVLELYPRTYGEEAGVRSIDTPSGSFRLLVMAMLMGARIRAGTAFDAARALFERRWTTAERMAAASWEERARVLKQAGYARFDERMSTMLGETAQRVLEQYRGDLSRLRSEADRDPSAKRRLLKEFKGIGDVGVDIFFREAQRSWSELYPFADRRALRAAAQLGLGSDARALTSLAQGHDFVRLVNGLVRVDLDEAYDQVKERASRHQVVASA